MTFFGIIKIAATLYFFSTLMTRAQKEIRKAFDHT